MGKTRIGVIGVGKLGMHHARIYSLLDEVELIGVVDKDLKKGSNIAHKYNTEFYENYKDLLGKVDGVSIAAPTPLHYEISKYFLENNVHCLVEKPITTKLSYAEELVDIARRKELILQVGHIERFNSGVIEAGKYIKDTKFIEINRLGPYDPRVSHVGVVLDLMIHDLDIVLFLTKSRVVKIDAIGAKMFSEFEDIANVRLSFENGCVANISASRISLDRFRKIRVFQDDSYISLDYEKQKLKVYSKKSEKVKSLNDINILNPKFKQEEPLFLELKDFIKCIKHKVDPVVTGEHGRNALELALEIINKINEN